MTDTPSPKHIFMSYSRKDESAMRRVATFLREQGINVWVDNEKLVPGTPIWEEEIEKAINTAGAIVVIMSPDSKNSEWVRREISLAEQNHKRIFPVLVSGDEDSAITIRLITKQFVDIRKNENVGLSLLSTNLLAFLNADTSVGTITSDVVEAKPAKLKRFFKSWLGRILVGFVAALVAGQIIAMVPYGYYTINTLIIWILIAAGVFSGLIMPAHRVSIIMAVIGFFLVGGVFSFIDPSVHDVTYFIGAGFFLGVPLAAIGARILYWIKVIK